MARIEGTSHQPQPARSESSKKPSAEQTSVAKAVTDATVGKLPQRSGSPPKSLAGRVSTTVPNTAVSTKQASAAYSKYAPKK